MMYLFSHMPTLIRIDAATTPLMVRAGEDGFHQPLFRDFIGVARTYVLVDDKIEIGDAECEQQQRESSEVQGRDKPLQMKHPAKQGNRRDHCRQPRVERANHEVWADDRAVPPRPQRHAEDPGGDGVDRHRHGNDDDRHDGDGSFEVPGLRGVAVPPHSQGTVQPAAPLRKRPL